jgi:hypothetical protein
MDQATALNLPSASRFAQSRRLRTASVISARKKGRLRCHKRPKAREETPKEGSDSGWGGGGRYRIPVGKMIAISGSIERR